MVGGFEETRVWVEEEEEEIAVAAASLEAARAARRSNALDRFSLIPCRIIFVS